MRLTRAAYSLGLLARPDIVFTAQFQTVIGLVRNGRNVGDITTAKRPLKKKVPKVLFVLLEEMLVLQ